ncbi:MAG: hypothetical protein NT150_03705 [Bacteroidetes bacterium]|nr:hypothetical protein [Bacteroidota bacterium]
MIKSSLLFSFGLLLILGFSSPSGSCKLEYDGLYYAPLDTDYVAYLKFYSDGTVLHTTSIENIEEVTKFFTKEYKKNILSGTYNFGKCNINFNTVGKTGVMKFSGSLEGDTMYLKATNANTHTSSELKFAYYEPALATPKEKGKTKGKEKSKN